MRVPAPRSLEHAQTRPRRLRRKKARQQPGSGRQQRTSRRIGRVHARAANVRRDPIHKATTAPVHGCDHLVTEDLHVAGVGARNPGAGTGGQAANRTLSDAALGGVRRQLAYKAGWDDTTLTVADRW